MTDTESDEFGIWRGTKQGDPVSSLLFHEALQHATERNMKTWRARGLGVKLGEGERGLCTVESLLLTVAVVTL